MRNSTASPRTSRTAAPSTSCPRPFRHISRSSSASLSARSPCSASARHAIRSWKSASKLSRNYSFTQIKGLPVAVPFHIHSSKAKALHYFFAATGQSPCTEWPRTDMRDRSRKVNSGRQCVPQSPRRPEPSPCVPRFAAHLRCVSAKGRFGVSRGARKPFGVLAPFVSAGRHRSSPPPDGGAYSFFSAEEASAAGDAFFVLFPGLPITLSMYAGTS